MINNVLVKAAGCWKPRQKHWKKKKEQRKTTTSWTGTGLLKINYKR